MSFSSDFLLKYQSEKYMLKDLAVNAIDILIQNTSEFLYQNSDKKK